MCCTALAAFFLDNVMSIYTLEANVTIKIKISYQMGSRSPGLKGVSDCKACHARATASPYLVHVRLTGTDGASRDCTEALENDGGQSFCRLYSKNGFYLEVLSLSS